MPDVWTTNPPKLRKALELEGATCGVEPRVLKPRDSEWTCHINGDPISYDVYIHDVRDLTSSWDGFLPLFVLCGGIGVLLGLYWGKLFWRRSP
jgi:hypothetical protein